MRLCSEPEIVAEARLQIKAIHRDVPTVRYWRQSANGGRADVSDGIGTKKGEKWSDGTIG